MSRRSRAFIALLEALSVISGHYGRLQQPRSSLSFSARVSSGLNGQRVLGSVVTIASATQPVREAGAGAAGLQALCRNVYQVATEATTSIHIVRPPAMAVIWVSERLDKGPMPASAVFQMGSRRTTVVVGPGGRTQSDDLSYDNVCVWQQMVPRDSRLIASRERAGGVRNPHEDYGLWTLDCRDFWTGYTTWNPELAVYSNVNAAKVSHSVASSVVTATEILVASVLSGEGREAGADANQWADVLMVVRDLGPQQLPMALKPVLVLVSEYLTRLLIAVRNPGGKKTPQVSACPTRDIVQTLPRITASINEAVINRSQTALKMLPASLRIMESFTGDHFDELKWGLRLPLQTDR
ncbi:hypothetical protein BJV77DRAFT_958753 [Russula vinacea]|nr:hypothetical protein BJV77DRAFT_958753 [Russula vinacea]